jgi:hypothetical protein
VYLIRILWIVARRQLGYQGGYRKPVHEWGLAGNGFQVWLE